MTQLNAAASATHTSAQMATTGAKLSATASALLRLAFMLALPATTGTANSADADAYHRTAPVARYTPFTIPKLAHASALRTPKLHAQLPNTSTVSLAIASVPQPHVLQATTSILEVAHALRNTALALSVPTTTLIKKSAVAFPSFAPQATNGILKPALANAMIWFAMPVHSLILLLARAAAPLSLLTMVSIGTWMNANKKQ